VAAGKLRKYEETLLADLPGNPILFRRWSVMNALSVERRYTIGKPCAGSRGYLQLLVRLGIEKLHSDKQQSVINLICTLFISVFPRFHYSIISSFHYSIFPTFLFPLFFEPQHCNTAAQSLCESENLDSKIELAGVKVEKTSITLKI